MTPRKKGTRAGSRLKKESEGTREERAKSAETGNTPAGDVKLLLQALEHFDVCVRMENCPGDGGLVRMQHKNFLFLNPRADIPAHKEICINALKHFDTTGLHIPPRLRLLLGEQEWG